MNLQYKLVMALVSVGTMLLATACAPKAPPPKPDSTTQQTNNDLVNPPTVGVTPEKEPDRHVDVIAPPPPDTRKTSDYVGTGVGPPREARLSDADKQEVLQRSLLGLQRMMIHTKEIMVLPTGNEQSAAAKNVLSRRLSEIGFTVIEGGEKMDFNPSQDEQNDYRKNNNVNLVFLLRGESQEVDKLGNFFSFDANLNGKVINLTTHQSISSTEVRKRGKRELSQRQAAQSALEAAAKDVVTYLTDEVARKWEATSLVKVKLMIGNLNSAASADDIRVGMQKRVGIYYVSFENWNEKQKEATYDVLCRFDVKDKLPGYVEELRKSGVEIKSIDQYGEVIKAKNTK